MKLVLNEENRISTRPGYRTAARTLRKLAEAPMILELNKSLDKSMPGDWDRFQLRNIGLAVQGRMAEQYNGDAGRIGAASVKELTRVLGIRTEDCREDELSVLSDFAVTVSLVKDLSRWSPNEKQGLLKIIQAKAGADEARYLKLMQRHGRLRNALINLGSSIQSSIGISPCLPGDKF